MGARDGLLVVAVKALVIRRGRVLVLRRSSAEDVDPGLWDLPGGRMRFGEDPLEALGREVTEEAGLDVEILGPVSVWQFRPIDPVQVVGITFVARWRSGDVVLSDEHDDFAWIVPDTARDLPMAPGLRDEIERFAATE